MLPFFFKNLPLQKLVIHGHSMEPTLREGQIVFATNILYFFSSPKINDIVVFVHDKKLFIKRVVKKNENTFFLQGDNKHDSLDSRKIGWIKRKDIVGKVIYAS